MSEPARRLGWAERGASVFLSRVDDLPDSAFASPSALPDWTVAHLVAHVAYNAQALSRLVHWARTGERTPMYSSVEARNAEIEQGAALPPRTLRTLVRETDERLRAELAALPAAAWESEVVTAQGRTVPATEIPWMRTREVWIHSVDLGTGAEFADFPADLVDALLDDVTALRQRQGRSPALLLRVSDRHRTWQVDVEGEPRATVAGTAARLCRWLTGRGDEGLTAEDTVPELSRWL